MQALTANASSGPLLRDKSGGGSHNDRLSILRDVPDERFTFELTPLRPLGDGLDHNRLCGVWCRAG